MSAPRRRPDPATLVFSAPAISPGEDWRSRSLQSWLILARHEGLDVQPTDEGGRGFPTTWCGNVRVDRLLYRVHRAPRLRFWAVGDNGNPTWLLHTATYVEPVTREVEVIDPRQDRAEHDPARSLLPRRATERSRRNEPPSVEPDFGP